MLRVMTIVLLGVGLAASAAAAETADGATTTEQASKQTCRKAEINPVTGHVFCFDPIGAAVEAPPDSLKPKCEVQSRGQWTWAPNCTPDPEGM
jgi:hypothetical protein